MGSLVGKKVFITGAEQGIGKETARKLIEAGCDIYIHYFSGEEGPRELMAIAEQKGGRAACGYADFTQAVMQKHIREMSLILMLRKR